MTIILKSDSFYFSFTFGWWHLLFLLIFLGLITMLRGKGLSGDSPTEAERWEQLTDAVRGIEIDLKDMAEQLDEIENGVDAVQKAVSD